MCKFKMPIKKVDGKALHDRACQWGLLGSVVNLWKFTTEDGDAVEGSEKS